MRVRHLVMVATMQAEEPPRAGSTAPAAAISSPALLSPVRLHARWMIGVGAIAAVLVLALCLLLGTRYETSAQIALDGGRTLAPNAVRARILSPDRLARVADAARLHSRLARPDAEQSDPRAYAAAWLAAHIDIVPTDLTNLYVIAYHGPFAGIAAPAVNAIAGDFTMAERRAGRSAAVVAPAPAVWLPTGPTILPFALALIAAIGGAAGAFLLRERRTPGIRDPGHARRRLGVRTAMLVPAIDGLAADDRTAVIDRIVEAPDSLYARAFQRWMRRIGPQGRSIAICSSMSGEGKSTSAVALARTAALAGLRVVLIDGDARIRAVSRLFGAEGRPGLVELVRGRAGIDETLIADSTTSLTVIGNSREETISHLIDRRATERLRQIMRQLEERFDLVVIDTPPLLAVAEAVEMASVADEVLLIARWRQTPLPAIRRAIHVLRKRGIAANLALTFVQLRGIERPVAATGQVTAEPEAVREAA